MDLKIIQQKLVGNDEERAVSPVIGVILMVAITVILAAVIAAFVLDLGDTSDPAPTTTFDYSTDTDWQGDGTDDDLLHISHSGGDPVEFDDLRLVIRDDTGAEVATLSGSDWQADGGDIELDGASGEFSVGDSATLTASDSSGTGGEITDDADLEVQIIHTPSNSQISNHEFTVPSNP